MLSKIYGIPNMLKYEIEFVRHESISYDYDKKIVEYTKFREDGSKQKVYDVMYIKNPNKPIVSYWVESCEEKFLRHYMTYYGYKDSCPYSLTFIIDPILDNSLRIRHLRFRGVEILKKTWKKALKFVNGRLTIDIPEDKRNLIKIEKSNGFAAEFTNGGLDKDDYFYDDIESKYQKISGKVDFYVIYN